MNEEILDSDLIEKEFIYQDNLTRVERWKSMLLDHVIVCFTVLPILMIPFLMTTNNEFKWIEKNLIILVFGIYLNKDVFRGRSPAKRILGQVVIDINTKKPANEIKCAIRNFTDIFWIFEVIVIQISPNRRIGDLIAGTKVVRADKEDTKNIFRDFQNSNKKNWIISLGTAVTYIWIVFQLMNRILII